jgi:O-antigen ligase
MYSTAADISLWIAAILLAALLFLPTEPIRMRAVDWSVLLLAAFEIPSLLFSEYRANSIRVTVTTMIFVLTYSAVRLGIQSNLQAATFSGLLALGGGWLALSGLSQFHENANRLGEAGLTNLVAFRSMLISPPSPWIPGEWFTLLLLALPFACVAPVYLWKKQRKWLAATATLVPLLIATTLCLSLSRAVFWGVVVFCFLLCAFLLAGRLLTVRAAGIMLGAALAALVLILAAESAFYPGLLKAYSGQHTSQVRSTQGRFEIWNRSIEVVRAHPLLGVGSGNAALSLTSTADQEETTGFASRTFSLPIQVLVEKGSVGFLIYCTFLILVAREFIRTICYSPSEAFVASSGGRKKSDNASPADSHQAMLADLSTRKAMACCFAAGLVAVLFRELTYSSLFEHKLTLGLVAVMSALVCLPEPEN